MRRSALCDVCRTVSLARLSLPHVPARGGRRVRVARGGPVADFAWTRGEPAFFASSNLATRGFCRDCGTPLSFAYNQPEARIYVTIGSMDDPELAGIELQCGVESKISWVEFCEG